jgi:hypothetical protein
MQSKITNRPESRRDINLTLNVFTFGHQCPQIIIKLKMNGQEADLLPGGKVKNQHLPLAS